jgi:malto-oligosyltrehalose trehalohydrolase/4-alpha-glucanotransferase
MTQSRSTIGNDVTRSVPAAADGPAATDRAVHFGPALLPDGGVRFRLWAPSHRHMRLVLEDQPRVVSMTALRGGWHEAIVPDAGPGTRYRFELTDGRRVADPASRFQPEDVMGPSEVVDPLAYGWSDAAWGGRPWHETVLYEIHVGAFTPEGTFRAAIGKLGHLRDLGVTAVELMPVADFAGRRNWGYDGVLPFAPDSAYGRPDDLKALVDAAHGLGLMVFLDLVYNHFGPEGSWVDAVAPEFLTDRHRTPWGRAMNFDGPGCAQVREFFIANALYWVEEFHVDGLRLDAVHAMVDSSRPHFVEALAERVRRRVGPARHVHLAVENADNAARFLARDHAGRPRFHDAQWNDDLHHGLHTAATGEREGYYAPYAGRLERLGRALAEGFAFQGEPRGGSEPMCGEPSAHLPPTAFVSFLQNHDHVGNRAQGERIGALAPPEVVRAVAAIYLLAPQIPLLFMGEEWSARQPFPFFCDFQPPLADAVREGRRAEFSGFAAFEDPHASERIPDPIDERTFAAAKLAWDDAGRAPHAEFLAWYRQVLAVRHEHIVPRLAGAPGNTGVYEVLGSSGVSASWHVGDGSRLTVHANLSGSTLGDVRLPRGKRVWVEGQVGDDTLGPWSVAWVLAEPSALDRLSRRMGIEEEYASATGEVRRTDDRTKRALLAAMNMPVRDEADAARHLDDLDRAAWARPLPPVVVTREAQPLEVPVALAPDAGTVRWTVAREDGAEESGAALLSEMPLQGVFTLDGRPVERRVLRLSGRLPLGYHRLRIQAGDREAETTIIATPARCHVPAALERDGGVWGVSAQLYALRSARNWGIGDFGDLGALLDTVASWGAGVVGLNPLHALFLDRPEHASPYAPASRGFLNPLYIDVEAVPEMARADQARHMVAAPAFRAELDAARVTPLVDYAAVARLKLAVLEALHAAFREGASKERRASFSAFRREQGEALELFCRFQALREHFAAGDPERADWRRWPEAYREPRSDEVARFAAEREDRIEFLAWLQWLADVQLAALARRAAERHMPIGLYRDLAVGAHVSGAETWTRQRLVLANVHVGAPPDIFNPAGQDWGLPAFDPHVLREQAFEGFVALVRANMRSAGGLRIDHVMALQHLYWIPEGLTPAEGAYVSYPMDDLLGILALESQRHRCLVVGEDLGTVPIGFRERLAEAGVLSYRVVFFEWNADGSFVGAAQYPRLALATVGSHDLATIKGWWAGRDIELKAELGRYPDAGEPARQRERRAHDKAALIEAIRAEGIALPEGFDAASPYTDRLTEAVHAFLARTNAALAMVQLEDLVGQEEQMNVPGTTTEHPNWRRKLPVTLDDLARHRDTRIDRNARPLRDRAHGDGR